MRIGVTPGKYAQQIHDALTQRIGMQAEFIAPEVDAHKYDLVLAVDDEDAPPGAKTRRYVTHHKAKTSSWDVVAARHLLVDAEKRGAENPVAVPLPIAVATPIRPAQTGLALVENKQTQEFSKILNAAGHQVLDINDPEVGIVVDLSATTSRIEPLRQAMSEEKVVIAMRANPAATDTIHDKSDGRLISSYNELKEVVEELVSNDFERQRLGFEARKAIANTNWARVVRGLLLDGRSGMPVLEHLSQLAAQKRWKERLGHAHPWKSAQYVDDRYLELGNQRIDISQISQLRKLSIAIAPGRRDPYSPNS